MRQSITALLLTLFLLVAGSIPATAQLASGKVTTAAPTYVNNTGQPLSLDTSGNLRVVSGGAPVGTQDVNVLEIGGTAVSNTTPGLLDINCLSGCVAGSGVINYTNTAAAPSYVEGTDNAASADLAGNARVTLTTALPTGANTIGSVSVVGGSVGLLAGAANIGNVGLNAGTNNIGDVDIASALPAGTNNIGDVDIASALPAGTNNIGDVDVLSLPVLANQATSNFTLVAAATTNSTSVKGSAGIVYEVSAYNNSANIAYLKFYNVAGAPTCNSDTVVAEYLIPASTSGAGMNLNIALGKSFTTGIGICVTNGIAVTDNTAVAASAFVLNVTYK